MKRTAHVVRTTTASHGRVAGRLVLLQGGADDGLDVPTAATSSDGDGGGEPAEVSNRRPSGHLRLRLIATGSTPRTQSSPSSELCDDGTHRFAMISRWLAGREPDGHARLGQ